MEKEFMVGVVAVVAVFGILFGSIYFSEHLSHIQKMECMKQRGEYIGKSCIFREAKPA